ncbi:MAG: choice-of-anchor Q domain-containing protein [Xenococcus sp. (in: cyanobacteria)]
MTTFTVNNTDDSGLGSLRQAIADANVTTGLDTIEFADNLSGQTITLTSGELQITDDLIINGLGSELLTISGNNTDRVFLVDDENDSKTIDVTLDGLIITEGTNEQGGGIRNLENLTLLNSRITNNTGEGISSGGGNLTLDNSIISENAGTGISHAYGYLTLLNSSISNNLGWGIGSSSSNLEITESTISGNRDGGMSFALLNFTLTNSTISHNTGSGIRGDRVNFEIDNSTISGNRTTGDGGGISGGSYNFEGTITNSTITNNIADSDGDGIGNGGGVNKYIGGGGISFSNTIVAGNFDNSPAGSEQHRDISGGFYFSDGVGYNLIGDITGARFPNLVPTTEDLFGNSDNPIDPLLGRLQNNGGFTQTHALLVGSPAIDAGNPDLEPTDFDQRGAGFPRVLDGDGNGTAIIDLGAFEFNGGLNRIRVEAEDYTDYFDTTPDNIGGAYRNDEVDIETSLDFDDGFSVGWIDQGEWLTYEVDIPEDSLYQVFGRVASASNQAHSINISLDGESTSLDFGATGGWNNWIDVGGEVLNLSAGSHELRLDMDSSAFNINYIDFIPLDDSLP